MARIVPLERKRQYKFFARVYMYASVENMGGAAVLLFFFFGGGGRPDFGGGRAAHIDFLV